MMSLMSTAYMSVLSYGYDGPVGRLEMFPADTLYLNFNRYIQ